MRNFTQQFSSKSRAESPEVSDDEWSGKSEDTNSDMDIASECVGPCIFDTCSHENDSAYVTQSRTEYYNIGEDFDAGTADLPGTLSVSTSAVNNEVSHEADAAYMSLGSEESTFT